MAKAFAVFGRVDVIVNNAGAGLFGPLEDTTPEDLRHLFDVDVLSPITIIRSALADAENPPLHLLLGSDAHARADRKITEIREEMATWKDLACGTDFPPDAP